VGNALDLKCPNCKATLLCNVVKTFPINFNYVNKDFFESFSGQEGNFRQRTRDCVNCGSEFLTVEIDEAFLSSLKEKIVFSEYIRKRLENLSSEANILLELTKSKNSEKIENLIKNKSEEIKNFENHFDLITAILGNDFILNIYSPAFFDKDFQVRSVEWFASKEFEEILTTLTPKEEKVIKMYFGIGKSQTRNSLEEIAKHFENSRTEIQKVIEKALKKLRHPSRSRRLRRFLAY